MRILMTQRELLQAGGSEMVVVEVARTLAERGHDVVVFCPKVGDMARMLLPAGARVVRELRDVPWTPDLIHGQHHLPAMAAIARFPGTRAIYHCHGTMPWVEQPPRHVRILKYVMMCEWMVVRAQAEFDLPPERVTCVPNFVNTTRFSEVRQPPEAIRRALLFGGPALPDAEFSRLNGACAALGIELDWIGRAYQNVQPRPEIFLQDYDLVFGMGKSALEAMATGCAVIPVVPGQAGQLITSETFDQWAHANFGPRYFTAATQISTLWLKQLIEAYRPADVAAVTARVRRERTLEGAVDRIEAIYREVSATPAELSADTSFAPYLEGLAREVDALWLEREAVPVLRKRVDDLEAKLFLRTPRRRLPRLRSLVLRARYGCQRLWRRLRPLRQ
jgi:hypothetical protein